MFTRFFSPADVLDYFERGVLKEHLYDQQMISICSIVDVLDVCEAFKKGNLSISYLELQERFNGFQNRLVKEGIVFVADLDQANLSVSLFERDDGIVTDLWLEAASREVSPKRSIRCLTLRVTDPAIWWAENVYSEMRDYHSDQVE